MKILIAICSSYIKNDIRLNYLNQMIESYILQTIKCPLYISICYNDEFKDKIGKLIRKYHNINFIDRGPIKLPQFTQYRLLIDHLSTIYIPNNTYLIFSDDDDLWSKNRICVYNTIMNTYSDTIFNIKNSTLKVWCNKMTIESQIITNIEHINICLTIESFDDICSKIQSLGYDFQNRCYDLLLSINCSNVTTYNIEEIRKLCKIKDKFLYFYRRDLNIDFN